jgi:hypothetical protein
MSSSLRSFTFCSELKTNLLCVFVMLNYKIYEAYSGHWSATHDAVQECLNVMVWKIKSCYCTPPGGGGGGRAVFLNLESYQLCSQGDPFYPS